MRRRQQDAGGAEAALQRVMADEGLLQHIEGAGIGQALDGGDVRALHLDRVAGAAAHRPARDQDGAGPTYPVLAADVDAENLQLVAQEIGEQHARLGKARTDLAVHRQGDALLLLRRDADAHRATVPFRRAASAARNTTRSASTWESARR